MPILSVSFPEFCFILQDPVRLAFFRIINLSSHWAATFRLFALTNDYASDGASLLDVSGLLCKHALSPLKQSNVALDILSIGDLGAAAVGFSHSHKATYLQDPNNQDENEKNTFQQGTKSSNLIL